MIIRCMNFRDKDKFFCENTPHDPNNVNLKQKVEFVCFSLFRDPKNTNCSIFNRGCSKSNIYGKQTQTMKKKNILQKAK